MGVGEARSRKNKWSESLGAAGRPGPADPVDPTMGLHFVHKCRNVTHLCFDLILPDSRLAGNHRFCHAGIGYRSSFPHSTRSSQFLSFLSPKFELVPFPNLHHAVIFHFRSSLASLWLQKGMASLHLWLATEEKVMVYLLLISTDQAHKSRLEMFDFPILTVLTPKIFTRNEQQVKVTLPLQVPSKH